MIQAESHETSLWEYLDKIVCPVLIMRGRKEGSFGFSSQVYGNILPAQVFEIEADEINKIVLIFDTGAFA